MIKMLFIPFIFITVWALTVNWFGNYENLMHFVYAAIGTTIFLLLPWWLSVLFLVAVYFSYKTL